MIDQRDATEVLDWTLTAACLRVTARATLHPCLPTGDAIDGALRDHLGYLRRAVPLTFMAVMALLAPGMEHGAGADNQAIVDLLPLSASES
jgi:hypothetical protein